MSVTGTRLGGFAAIILFSVAAAKLSAQILPTGPSLGAEASFVVERGPVSARLSPVLSLSFGASLPLLPRASLYADLRGSAGAFMGQVLSLELGSGLSWNAAGSWEPRTGATLLADGGSWIFASSSSTVLPPPVQAYLGLSLDPLRFRRGRYAFSAGSLRAALGLDGTWTALRMEVGLLSLAWGTNR